MATRVEFQRELRSQFRLAERSGERTIEVNSGDLHRGLGGYPGLNHQMPSCCEAMYNEARMSDEIIMRPPKGKGASLTIRYYLPR